MKRREPVVRAGPDLASWVRAFPAPQPDGTLTSHRFSSSVRLSALPRTLARAETADIGKTAGFGRETETRQNYGVPVVGTLAPPRATLARPVARWLCGGGRPPAAAPSRQGRSGRG